MARFGPFWPFMAFLARIKVLYKLSCLWKTFSSFYPTNEWLQLAFYGPFWPALKLSTVLSCLCKTFPSFLSTTKWLHRPFMTKHSSSCQTTDVLWARKTIMSNLTNNNDFNFALRSLGPNYKVI